LFNRLKTKLDAGEDMLITHFNDTSLFESSVFDSLLTKGEVE